MELLYLIFSEIREVSRYHTTTYKHAKRFRSHLVIKVHPMVYNWLFQWLVKQNKEIYSCCKCAIRSCYAEELCYSYWLYIGCMFTDEVAFTPVVHGVSPQPNSNSILSDEKTYMKFDQLEWDPLNLNLNVLILYVFVWIDR